eukprot:Sspe_Gene.16820::Locus_5947_Transcript_1_2_Confidence_0.500_Length_1803::g.16820::m.16820
MLGHLTLSFPLLFSVQAQWHCLGDDSSGRPDGPPEATCNCHERYKQMDTHFQSLCWGRGQDMTKGVLSVNTTWAKGTNDILTFVIESTPRLKEIKTPCAKVIKGKVVWLVTKSDLEEIVPGLKESQWVSRIPGVADLCKK